MANVKGFLRKYSRKAVRLVNDLEEYIRLNLSRNQIERTTDFESCKRPVLLIHGFAGTRRIFTVLEKRLRKDGFCVFSINLGGLFDTFNTGGIILSASLIENKIKKLNQLYDLGPISIIGHSKGGLIGTYYAKFLDQEKKICSVITLGTPHRGSPWVFLGLLSPLVLISKSIRQMWPQSPFLRRLKMKKIHPSTRLVSIYSKADSVCPYPFCKLENDEEENIHNIEIDNVSHTQFVTGRRAYEEVNRELEKGLLHRKKENSTVQEKGKQSDFSPKIEEKSVDSSSPSLEDDIVPTYLN